MKRLMAVIVGAALLVNFLLFIISVPPYQKLLKMEPGKSDKGTPITVESVEGQRILKANIKNYIIINVGIMVVGISTTLYLRRK